MARTSLITVIYAMMQSLYNIQFKLEAMNQSVMNLNGAKYSRMKLRQTSLNVNALLMQQSTLFEEDDIWFNERCASIESTFKLISMTDDEILELLGNFEPEYDNFTKIVSNLIHSPYSQEHELKLIEKWYFTRKHHNDQTIELYVNKYYE